MCIFEPDEKALIKRGLATVYLSKYGLVIGFIVIKLFKTIGYNSL